jgi:PadR family transcriptional regulator PadR
MASPRIRLTTPVRMVLDALAHADPGSPLWGYKLAELTGLGSGTIYPIMERLESGKYVTARVETPKPADRPPRRFYELTGTGLQLAADSRASLVIRRRLAAEGPDLA